MGYRPPAEGAVRNYKRLTEVEQAFRSLKSVDMRIRPIYHRIDDRVRAHIFLCVLAYYVQWHLKRAWAPLLFEDEELEASRMRRDPVAPAEPSAWVKRKKSTHQTGSGLRVHSFATLLKALSTRYRNTCKLTCDPSGRTFQQIIQRDPLQAEAFRLLGL